MVASPVDDAERNAPSVLVDTHAHLQWPSLLADLDGVLARAAQAGVRRILTLGTQTDSCRRAVELAEAHSAVYAAVGLHPGDLPGDLDTAMAEVSAMLDHPRVVAIGETGLDYYHADNRPRDTQVAAFRLHLELAARSGKPVCVHNREATADVMSLLAGFAGRVVAVLHCFTGDLETARAGVEMGCYISFAGNATYPKLRDLLQVAAEIPPERLLVETDAPFLAPQARRGRRNEPAHIVDTYDAVAAARGTSRGELGRLVTANARRLFGWAAVPARGEGEAA